MFAQVSEADLRRILRDRSSSESSSGDDPRYDEDDGSSPCDDAVVGPGRRGGGLPRFCEAWPLGLVPIIEFSGLSAWPSLFPACAATRAALGGPTAAALVCALNPRIGNQRTYVSFGGTGVLPLLTTILLR